MATFIGAGAGALMGSLRDVGISDATSLSQEEEAKLHAAFDED
jgi:uncharacterized membrane protein